MKNTWFCQGCRKPIVDDEAGYDGCHIGCGHVLVTKGEAIDLAMQLLEFAGWQPMETAPRDGRGILVLFLGEHISIAKWRSCYNDWRLGCYKPAAEDLHGWLPLPEMEVRGMSGEYVPTLAVPKVTRQYWQLVMVDLESAPRGLYGMDEHRANLHKELAAHYDLTHDETKRITDNMDKIKYGSQGLHQALQDMWYDQNREVVE